MEKDAEEEAEERKHEEEEEQEEKEEEEDMSNSWAPHLLLSLLVLLHASYSSICTIILKGCDTLS